MWGENDVAIKGEDAGVAKTNLERDRKALAVKLKTQDLSGLQNDNWVKFLMLLN